MIAPYQWGGGGSCLTPGWFPIKYCAGASQSCNQVQLHLRMALRAFHVCTLLTPWSTGSYPCTVLQHEVHEVRCQTAETAYS